MFCGDFDLYTQCYEKVGHPYKMEKLGLLDDASSPSDDNKTNSQEAARKLSMLSIQRCIQSLVHACQCTDANYCRFPKCKKMIRVMEHTKVCKRKTNGGCPICKQLIALGRYHGKTCLETKCLVPFCLNIKYKLRQQQLQQLRQRLQAQLFRRKSGVMSRTAPSTNVISGGNSSGLPVGGGVGQHMVPGAMPPEGLLDNNSSSPSDNNETNSQEAARRLSIQRCIQSLVHACQCRDANCRLPSCKKMSRVVNHTKVCKRKTNGGCPICKQLIALCCYHAKNCPETKCPMPFCSNIKYRIEQQQLQQRSQQPQLFRRKSTPSTNVTSGGNCSGLSVAPSAVSPAGGMN